MPIINELNATLNRYPDDSLPTYWERSLNYPHEPAELLSRHETPTRLLTNTERATVRIDAPEPFDCPQGSGILYEATVRLALFRSRGVLPHSSGHYIARQLESVFGSRHPFAQVRALVGWELLRALDAADLGTNVWISGEPTEPLGRYRRMRLAARCAEFGNSHAERRVSEIR
ncbi:hypothetical protein ASE14_18365 [Agromyces sp. Root81]|uniref:hypothetical protein n=1 Tax=Agromyces sp. Root81 TaxID=1736601 RepID=UPI0007010755|nr:hypothetical protein [Agromyces sp. Root81]KRC58541.1 hypothetical protein ASE14_18365 [Agromyces sp. Root81]